MKPLISSTGLIKSIPTSRLTSLNDLRIFLVLKHARKKQHTHPGTDLTKLPEVNDVFVFEAKYFLIIDSDFKQVPHAPNFNEVLHPQIRERVKTNFFNAQISTPWSRSTRFSD